MLRRHLQNRILTPHSQWDTWNMRALSINIIGKSNGVGLARDLQLLKSALCECGYDVAVTLIDRVQANRRRSPLTQLLTRSQLTLPFARKSEITSDVNVMLEHVWQQYLPTARWNIVLPNPEWFDSNDVRFLAAVDEVWAKTLCTAQIFSKLGRQSTFVGFDSEDRYRPAVTRDRSFFHLAGKSSMKGTDRLLRVWARHPEWPTLRVVQHGADAHAPEIRAQNIERHIGYIDDDALRDMQNASAFHLCLSLTEGWGHYIVEALSVGAVTLTVDAAPMNELASVERGVLVRYGRTGRQKLATTHEFDEAALEQAIAHVLVMPDDECARISANARRWFLDNRAGFPARLRAAVEQIPLQADQSSPIASSARPVTAQALPRWANRWRPSMRLRKDPLRDLQIQGRYSPASIANWKLIPSVARHLLSRRIERPLQFDAGGRLTVLIPFRDRQAHLERLLPPLTDILASQQIEHRIVVVEQLGNAPFNRGKLLNVGMKQMADSSDYYCLHDVDAIPLVANYRCPSQPLRLVNRVIRGGKVELHHDYYFSGAVSVRKEQAFFANGFSNDYCGWGKEDDDFFFRLLLADCLCFYDAEGVFEDLPNPEDQQVRRSLGVAPPHVRANRRRRSRLLRGLADPAADGLSTTQYEVVAQHRDELYERICVRF